MFEPADLFLFVPELILGITILLLFVGDLLVSDPRRKRTILEGEIPDPVDIPAGCRFHPRCPAAIPSCRETDPELRTVEPGHEVACIRV